MCLPDFLQHVIGALKCKPFSPFCEEKRGQGLACISRDNVQNQQGKHGEKGLQRWQLWLNEKERHTV